VDDLLGSFRGYNALCINKQDLSERSAQVRQIRQIYQKAECVGVWLGPEANNSSLAWNFVKKYTDYTKTFDPQYSSLNGDRKDLEEHSRPFMDEWIVGALENPEYTPS
jgi:hypothetical protein